MWDTTTKFEEYLFSKEAEQEDSQYFKVTSVAERPQMDTTSKRSILQDLLNGNGASLKERDRELYQVLQLLGPSFDSRPRLLTAQ